MSAATSRAVAELGSSLGDLPAGLLLTSVLRQVPGRRVTCSATLGGQSVVVKAFGSPRARGNHRRLQALHAAGLGDLVPEPLAVSTDGRVGVLSFTAGRVLDTVEDHLFVNGAGLTGAALRRLHGSRAGLDRAWTHGDELTQLLRQAPSETRAWCERVARLPVADGQAVPAHRDLHPRQVVITDAGLARFIDLDDLARAPRGLDVGNFLAHLQREAVIGRRSPAVAAAAADAFVEAYGPQPADVATWQALALVRLAGLAHTRHGSPAERDAVIRLLEQQLRRVAGSPHGHPGVAPPIEGVASETGTSGGATVSDGATSETTIGEMRAPRVTQILTGHADRPVRVEVGASGAVVVKGYHAIDGSRIFAQMHQLWRSPFGASRLPVPGLPQPLSFDPGTHELRMTHLPGDPLGRRAQLGASLVHAAAVGVLLADLHGSGVTPERVRHRSGLVRSTRRKVADWHGRRGADDFRQAAEAIEAAWALPDSPPLPLVPSHGDFSPRNVLAGPKGLVLIDLDRLQLAEPQRDLGYWSAWLWATAALSDRAAPTASGDPWELGEPVLHAYAARSGYRVEDLRRGLGVHQAVALVRIAHGWSSLRGDDRARARVLAEARRRCLVRS